MTIVRRFGLLAYWVAFGAYAVYESQYAGALGGPDSWQIRSALALVILAILGIAVGILHVIIRPKSYSISAPRFGKAFGYSVVLLFVFSSVSVVTDMPPVIHVPSRFAIVTAALTLMAAVAEAVAIEVKRRRE